MAAAVNTNVPATAALSSRGAASNSSPWSQVEVSVSLVTNAVDEVEEQCKGELLNEDSKSNCDGNASKKPPWNKPVNVAPGSGPIMGAVSWPSLSESTKASPKPPSGDSSANPSDSPDSAHQVATTTVDSSPASSITSNPNPIATQHHGRPGPGRQRSMRREGVGNSSSDGSLSHQPPQLRLSSVGEGSLVSNVSTNTENVASDSSRRDHGHNYAYREGGRRDNPSQRNFQRSNSGPLLRGDGSFGGRRDQDRANPGWSQQRSFNGRGPLMPQQRGGPRGFVRPHPPIVPYIPPPIQAYGNRIGIPPEMRPPYYFPSRPGMPFFLQMPPAVYFPPSGPQLSGQIINQIDFYFSNGNLVKDIYLRQNMDEHGWVPIQLIARFNKVRQLTNNIKLILDSLQGSTVVEIQGDKIRKRDDWMRWIIPSSVQLPTPSAPQSPPGQDALIVHVQGLTINESSANQSDGNAHGETSKDGSSSSGR